MIARITKPKQHRYVYTKPDGSRGWRTNAFLSPPKPYHIAMGGVAMAKQGLSGEMLKAHVPEQIERAREFFAMAFPQANAAIDALSLTLVTEDGFAYNMERRVWLRIEGSRRRLQAFLDGHGDHLEKFWPVMHNSNYMANRDPQIYPQMDKERIIEYLPFRLNHESHPPREFGLSMQGPYYHTFGDYYHELNEDDRRPYMRFRTERDLVMAKLLLG